MIGALIWDVDGTLSETEETQRCAFNETFRAFAIDWNWDRLTYKRLLLAPGGIDRLRTYADETGNTLPDDLLRRIYADKTHRYVRLLERGGAPLRPGVAALIAAAQRHGVRQAIATTTSRANVEALIAATLERPAAEVFQVIAAGDEVRVPKPAPDVFLLALERLGLPASDCIVIEDSQAGMTAARAAGLRVLITPSEYARDTDFSAADWVLPDLTAPLPDPLACLTARHRVA
ncbi:MAG: HAD-IA family hydrolase [Paracoccus sp. (in: a-proteobacteria)]|uniref:HAD-IA family hydrolase n=1 Tax=Paracoccus sp. TaxID=267 RepID=UPI0026E05314|nr:HAD-IA family hydrolase [Paracoccus sp. (in: a-proteobacteria)]MDO5612215.1 HAD-IA family hydrolase [Paracoccus sp. (in: a-proteobacteria)]